MVGEHPTQTTLPGDDLKPAWRAACIAYRKVRQAGALDQPAWLAARAAVRDVRPEMDEPTAGAQASAAIHYASIFHTKWLWHRVGDPKYWKPEPERRDHLRAHSLVNSTTSASANR